MSLPLDYAPAAIDPSVDAPSPAVDRSAEPPTVAGLPQSPVNDLQTETARALYQQPDRAVSNLNDLKETLGPEVATEVLARAPETYGAVTGSKALEAGVPQQYASVLQTFGDESWRSSGVGLDLPADALQRSPDGRPLVAPTDGSGRTMDDVVLAQAPPVGWVAGIIVEGRGQAPLFWGLGPSASVNVGIAVDNDEIALTTTYGGGVGAGGGVALGVGAYSAFGPGNTMNDVRDVGGLGVESGAFVGVGGVGVQGSGGMAINDALQTAGLTLGAPIGGPTFGSGAYIELQNTKVIPILNYQDLLADSAGAIERLPVPYREQLETVKNAAGQGDVPTGEWLLNVYHALRVGVTGR